MRPAYVRELTRYPVGARRVRYLFLAVLASLILNFEGQISPVVPLLLNDLGMSLRTYGLIAAVSVTAGAISAAIGGTLADRWGRTILLIPTLFLTAICDFATALVSSPLQLLILRSVLLFVEGAAITTTAGLVRDFSPRMRRATAFGFWTWGPVGSNFLAAGIAALTLPIFTTWRSQFVIIGSIALVCSVVIALFIADLAPHLRAQVISTEAELSTVESPEGGPVQIGQVRELLAHRRILAHLGGIGLWQLFYWTAQLFGPTILVQSFGLSGSRAAAVTTISWAINLVTIFAAGWLSDRLQMRKPLIVAGCGLGLVAIGYFVYLVGTGHATAVQLVAANVAIGATLALAFTPWMALYSEDVEDIRPDLQATAWGLFGLAARAMILVMLILAPVITAAGGSWQPWLVVTLVANAALLPATLAFGGTWRTRAAEPAPLSA